MATRVPLLLALCLGLAAAAPSSADAPQAAKLSQVVLYVPAPLLAERIGRDVKPLAEYIRALTKRADELLGASARPAAKGLLVVVGIRSKTDTRVWCQAVSGAIPASMLRRLENELAKIEAVDVKNGAASFAIQLTLFGEQPGQFPSFPDAWLAEAEQSGTPLMLPPDALFELIWPE